MRKMGSWAPTAHERLTLTRAQRINQTGALHRGWSKTVPGLSFQTWNQLGIVRVLVGIMEHRLSYRAAATYTRPWEGSQIDTCGQKHAER